MAALVRWLFVADFYGNLASIADRLLVSKGQTAIHTKRVEGSFDPSTGKDDTKTTQSQSVTIVKLPAAGGKIQALDNIPDGSSVARNTAYLLMSSRKIDGAPLDFEPEFDHKITINSVEWNISGATILDPDGTSVIYKVAIRR